MVTAILRLPTVKERTGLSRSAIYVEFILLEIFLRLYRLVVEQSVGSKRKIDNWLAEQIAASRKVTC